jgi:hypothetical protein
MFLIIPRQNVDILESMIREYLPSEKFGATLGALLAAAGFIAAASYVNPGSARLNATGTAAADLSVTNPRWQEAFKGDTTPEDMKAIQAKADELSAAIQDKNVTNSIAKSLAIQTLALQGQGIADSSYAQGQVIDEMLATAASKQTIPPPTYSQTDITLSTNSKTDLRTYGNTLPKLYASHPKASESATFLPLTSAVDRSSSAPLAELTIVAAQYRKLAAAIVSLPTPPIFTPTAMQLANNYAAMAVAIEDMKHIHDDPIRGMLGLENFKMTSGKNIPLLLSIGTSLKNSGIVYGKAEPGATWNALVAAANALSLQQASAQ